MAEVARSASPQMTQDRCENRHFALHFGFGSWSAAVLVPAGEVSGQVRRIRHVGTSGKDGAIRLAALSSVGGIALKAVPHKQPTDRQTVVRRDSVQVPTHHRRMAGSQNATSASIHMFTTDSRAMIARGGNYALSLKGNQGTLRR